MYEMRIKESDLVTKNNYVEERNKKLKENLHDLYDEFNLMYENNTFSANDVMIEEKWSEFKLLIKMHYVSSYMKEQKKKHKMKTGSKKRGVEL